MQIQLSKEYKLAHDIANALNEFGFNYNHFNAGVVTCHRTLQQSMMRLMVNTIRFMASDEYRTDDRNAATKALAVELNKVLEERGYYIPTI